MLTSDRLHREITWERHAVYWTAALLVPCLAFWWTRWVPLGPLMVTAVMVVALIPRPGAWELGATPLTLRRISC